MKFVNEMIDRCATREHNALHTVWFDDGESGVAGFKFHDIGVHQCRRSPDDEDFFTK